MNTLLIIYFVIGAIGFLFLLISLIVGDLFESFDLDFDADHDFDGSHGGGISIFSSRVISVFLTAFGGVGAVTLILGFSGWISALFGIGGGILFGAVVFAFGYFLYTQQASSSVTKRDLVGRTAKVIVGIQSENVGQISCLVGDEQVEKLARSRDGSEIKRGEMVFIEEVGDETLVVSPMTGYLPTDK